MNKRKLKRQLSLAQIVMLGTAGTIGAEIFVLTGYAAGLAGPAFVLALVLGGLMSYSIAVNYGELASSFPVTGGALTYVREAWGKNLLSYLVGSLDCLSSTFYAALSAVGFAYSLQLFLPFLPVVPTALAIIAIFVVLNILGVGNIGNVQIVLGGILLFLLLGYVVLSLVLPGGFEMETFLPGGRFFIHDGALANLSSLFSTVALAYVAFIGFEVIADDAEEIRNPDRNIPLGILISLTLCLLLYPLIALVTLGTVPWQQLAGSGAALKEASARFLPGFGPLLIGVAGIIATVTTLNSTMLSATREAFTMSRDGTWPRFLSRLGRFRTPYAATLVIGAIICAVAAIGLVDFLSYISSSGYLFVLFWSNLALVRLRRRYPNLRRPFKVPLFPLTAYLAMATCFFIIMFTERRALLFGAGLLAVLTMLYYLTPIANRLVFSRLRSLEKAKNRILVPVANPRTGAGLVRLAGILAQASEDTSICVLHVKQSKPGQPAPAANADSQPLALPRLTLPRRTLPRHILPGEIVQEVHNRNVPFYSKVREAPGIARGIMDEIETQRKIKMVLAGWPGPLEPSTAAANPVKVLLEKANTNLLVLLEHRRAKIHHILVPVGGGPHSRLALRVAYELAEQENARITALHTLQGAVKAEETQDQLLNLREIVQDELGSIPPRMATRVAWAETVIQGVLGELNRQPYELLVMGASEEWGSGTRLFGSVDDWIIEHVDHCSVLLVRKYEPVAIHWMRRTWKRMENGR